tara:strand:- start:421 stop:585 length:165 start_codon:yes stop_codon:yes gene_type:complete
MTHLELKAFRKTTGLNQALFAKKIFKTRDCIAKWESGKYKIPDYAAILFSAIFT